MIQALGEARCREMFGKGSYRGLDASTESISFSREARGVRKISYSFSNVTSTDLKEGVRDWGSAARGTTTLASGKYIMILPGVIG